MRSLPAGLHAGDVPRTLSYELVKPAHFFLAEHGPMPIVISRAAAPAGVLRVV